MAKAKGAPVGAGTVLPTGKALAQAKKNALPGSAQAGDLGLPNRSGDAAAAVRLAQVVNLHIAGYSLAAIGATIGASADEVDRLLARDAARYVRSQPALRVYIRNWISQRYTTMLEADWEQATDPSHSEKLEHQDRVLRILDRMSKLHGAEAPTQAEVKVDAAPEAVDKMVAALSAAVGAGYDTAVFDAEVIEDAVEAADEAVQSASAAVETAQPFDEEWGTDG